MIDWSNILFLLLQKEQKNHFMTALDYSHNTFYCTMFAVTAFAFTFICLSACHTHGPCQNGSRCEHSTVITQVFAAKVNGRAFRGFPLNMGYFLLKIWILTSVLFNSVRMKVDGHYQWHNCSQRTCCFWQYKVCADILGSTLERACQMRLSWSKMANFSSCGIWNLQSKTKIITFCYILSLIWFSSDVKTFT